MDSLLKEFRYNTAGMCLCGSFVEGAAHADDICTMAQSTAGLAQQAAIIDKFTETNLLHLNASKTEIICVSMSSFCENLWL